MSAEHDGGGSGGEVIAVFDSVLSSVGLDRYSDGLNDGVIHNCGHQSPLLIGSGNLDLLGVKACLGMLACDTPGTAPSDSLSAVAIGR